MRKTIQQLQNSNKPLACLTAYTAPIAKAADKHCDLLLVGDSLSMVLYGEDSTQKATMSMMIRHGQAVVRATEQAFIVVDMPFGSYEDSPENALTNAQKIMKETQCQAVKLEGGKAMAPQIKMLVEHNIPVMAHIGLLPQSVSEVSGYKVQGRDEDSAAQLMLDAKAVEQAGAFSMVIEAVPEALATQISQAVNIPTIGIGASNACDGQILVTEDMIGVSDGHVPKFVKKYANIHEIINKAMADYATDVHARAFPSKEKHTYKI
jgi:3-methyl-2-oxobutanoate hydroxymethyltransferase